MDRSEIVRRGIDKTYIARDLVIREGEVFVVPSESVIYVRSIKVEGVLYIDGTLKVIG